uniref:Laminin EGF-like domain-containing protein n=1 Tax=Oncorhynchus tshawytscha TaxID=74940 RepID=A0AAZ3QN41_ONCTS
MMDSFITGHTVSNCFNLPIETTVTTPLTKTEGICCSSVEAWVCTLSTEDVAGENCDHCKLGFHHLLGERLRGCEKCYCSSIASNCSDSHWTYSNETSMAGWSLTEADGEGKVWPTPSRDRDWPQILSNNNQEARRHLPAVYY